MNWYKFQNEVREGDEAADLYIYDVIGDSWDGESVTAKRFMADVNGLPQSVGRIRLHINSPGGSVFDAVAIANVLRAHRAAVDVSIEGLAASAATVVAMGGDSIGIAENALFMIHDPYGAAIGGAKEMRDMADALDRVRDGIVATYRWHSPLEPAAIAALMEKGTWMSAAEALERGFATAVTGATEARAELTDDIAARLGPVPERFANVVNRPASVKVQASVIVKDAPDSRTSRPLGRLTAKEAEMTDDEIQTLVEKTRLEAHEAGRTAERDRILGVEGALIQGHEKLIADLKRDPAITPGEAALRVNAAERTARDRTFDAIKRDGQATGIVEASSSSTGDAGAIDDALLPVEERAAKEWRTSPQIRDEFERMGGFESYLAIRKDEERREKKLHAVK
jgi:ATP-dependent Clp protease, protease subunit